MILDWCLLCSYWLRQLVNICTNLFLWIYLIFFFYFLLLCFFWVHKHRTFVCFFQSEKKKNNFLLSLLTGFCFFIAKFDAEMLSLVLVYNVAPVRKLMLVTKHILISPQQVELRPMVNQCQFPQSFSGMEVSFLFLDIKCFFSVTSSCIWSFLELRMFVIIET